MKKKIIFITQALWIGGIETALVNLLNCIDYNEYDVTVLVCRASLEMKEKINSKCRLIIIDREQTISFNSAYKYKSLYHLTEEPDNPSSLHNIMMWTVPVIKWFENRLYIRYIRDFIKEEHFDAAIIYSDVVSEIAIRAINADKYLMFYHHGAMRHVYHDGIAYKKCEKIIAVSQNQALELKKFVPKYADKITVINNFTDVKGIISRSLLPCEDTFDSEKYDIVTVGRVSYEKGMDLAVQACAKLVSNGFKNIKWWIVGDGPAMPEIKKLVSKLNMNDYVNLVGMKENPYPYIKNADLYVQPSRFESFGLTIKEAMILCKPIISTSTFGAKEIIQNRKNGILCSSEKNDLANKIEEFIKSSKLFNDMKFQHNIKDFEIENRKLMEELEKVIGG